MLALKVRKYLENPHNQMYEDEALKELKSKLSLGEVVKCKAYLYMEVEDSKNIYRVYPLEGFDGEVHIEIFAKVYGRIAHVVTVYC